jgi:nucleoside-diphosphate-sugar epimerase
VLRRVAVTGATGFIGRHLVADLVDRGIEVRAIVRGSPERLALLQSDGARGFQPSGTGSPERLALRADVSVVRAGLERAALADAFRDVDAVVHLAGVVSTLRQQEFIAVNVEGTREVADAARAAGARLIHVSSLAAAGPASAGSPRSEDDPAAPVTPYGRSKLESERVLAAMPDLRWIVLRPGIVYGPGDRALLPLFRFATRGVLPLVGRATAAYTVIHVSDLIRAIVAALDSNADRQTVFAGHLRPATGRELLDGVRSAVGGPARIVRMPMALTRLAAIAGDIGGAIRGRPLALNGTRYVELSAEGFVCRVDRLRDCLGIVAEVDLAQGLAQTATWYRQEHWL